MSRRLLNNKNLGVSFQSRPVENPFEMVKPTPIPVHTFVPSTPIFLTAEQWNSICDKTHDATTPFRVEVTVIDKTEEAVEEDGIGVEEVKDDEPYVPKRGRKSKK